MLPALNQIIMSHLQPPQEFSKDPLSELTSSVPDHHHHQQLKLQSNLATLSAVSQFCLGLDTSTISHHIQLINKVWPHSVGRRFGGEGYCTPSLAARVNFPNASSNILLRCQPPTTETVGALGLMAIDVINPHPHTMTQRGYEDVSG
ncbi:hypothetical protein DNTS_015980 [Danionella cerebrum]|uniref:Uncharacterized protein n=1 Tax=Danionella cerebrum TaxID=2873325 RepID=A0A553P0S3_9TELE|nr:hypothetical protein DNTS_015980 [Danionella translucida]